MSEKMNKKQAIEQIKDIKEYIINPHQAEPQSMLFKQTQREKRLQALDIAIESLKYDDEQVKFLKNSLDYVDNKKDNEWTDVRDGLPKKSGWYWVTQKFDFKGEFEYQNETDYEVNKEWFDSTKNEFDFTHKYIIAWQTYEPKPYERNEK